MNTCHEMDIAQRPRRPAPWYRLVPLLGLVTGCNCSCMAPFPPGTMREQQLRATFHDPYGDANLGGEIDGGRPLQYLNQRSEPTRSQWSLDQRGTF